MSRKRKETLVDVSPLDLSAVDGLLWAEEFGESRRDTKIENVWTRERAERITLIDLPILT